MKNKFLFAALVSAMVFGTGAAMETLEARSCKRVRTYAAGNSLTKTGARARAISNWRKRVRKKYSSRYAFYTRAKSKRMRCSKRSGRYFCTVGAKPCKL